MSLGSIFGGFRDTITDTIGLTDTDAPREAAAQQEALSREALAQEIEQRNAAQSFLTPFASNQGRRQELEAELAGLQQQQQQFSQQPNASDIFGGLQGFSGQNLQGLEALGLNRNLFGATPFQGGSRIAEIESELANFQDSPTDLGLNNASFLVDPQQQFDYLQSNPLFQLSLDNANRQTLQGGAASGRLNAGDTLQDLSNNVLLSASPLINQQNQNIAGLLDFGRGVATTQGNIAVGQGTNVSNILQNIGDVQAAGTIGAANQRTSGTQALLDVFGGLSGGLG